MNDDQRTQYYAYLGFKRNPFEGNTAEREPEIEHYAVRPPYLDPVEEASKRTGSYTLAGARGSGKSATRITVQRNIWRLDKPHPLPIALTNFNVMRGKRDAKELLDLFANQVFFLTIEACFVYLTSLDKGDADAVLSGVQKSSKKFLDWSLKNFYFNRPEEARTVSAQECCDAFAISMARRSQIWAEKKWVAISESVIDLTAAVAKRFDVDVGDTSSYKKIFAADAQVDVSDPLFILKKAVEFSRIMGFSGLLVQVDKVDEADWTNNDADAAARLIWPLFSNVQLHEIDGLSWSFFLWDRVRARMVQEEAMPVRWDKLPNETIKWNQEHLERLVERRLSHFSDAKVARLSQLFGDGSTDAQLYAELISLSGLAPRTLITILDSVLTHHIQEHEGEHKPMTMNSLLRGMDNYATTSILNEYTQDTIGQLQKLGATTFVTKDVAKAFTIGQQGARQKIDKWIGIGLARRNGQVFAGERTKPVDQFVISEPRAKRIVERNLNVAPL